MADNLEPIRPPRHYGRHHYGDEAKHKDSDYLHAQSHPWLRKYQKRSKRVKVKPVPKRLVKLLDL